MSVRPHEPGSEGWAVLDSGLKAQSTDSGLPVLVCDVREYHGSLVAGKDAESEPAPISDASAGDVTAAAAAAAGAVAGEALASALPLRSLAAVKDGAPHGVFASSVGHLVVKGVSDEHSTIVPSPAFATEYGSATPAYLPACGTKLLLLPGHCDPFVNHFDWIVGMRRLAGPTVVEQVWRVAARSPGI